jgi:predicted DNA-binding protein (MmcQ/YjbR family)
MHPLVKIDRRVLARVRKICLGWPEAGEAIKWGRPTFLAGKKLFACVDRQHDRPGVSFKVTPLLQAELVERDGFFPTPYSAHQGWVTVATDQPVDWDEIAEYLRVGYRLVATKRMLKAMDLP